MLDKNEIVALLEESLRVVEGAGDAAGRYPLIDNLRKAIAELTKPEISVEGRRWFQKTYGNTYHSVRIYVDGKEVAYLPFQYGYGDQFLQTALDWLKANGYAPADAEYGTRYLREVLNGSYTVIDVDRRRDL